MVVRSPGPLSSFLRFFNFEQGLSEKFAPGLDGKVTAREWKLETVTGTEVINNAVATPTVPTLHAIGDSDA